MDFIHLMVALAFWFATVAFALGCQRLQKPRVAP
jgi:hypothetical protein